MMLKLVPRLKNRRMHLFHRNAQLGPKPVHNISLPRIVLRVDPRLNLLVVDDAYAKALLRVRGIERRASFLNLYEELLPVCERVSETIEDVFGFEIPEGLELQPLGDVVLELLDLTLDQRKRSLKGIVRKSRQLSKTECQSETAVEGETFGLAPTKYMSFPTQSRFATATRSRILSFGFSAADKQHLKVRLSTQPRFGLVLSTYLSNRVTA